MLEKVETWRRENKVRQQEIGHREGAMAVIEFFEIVVGAAGFVTGQAAEAAISRLPLEGCAGGLG